jgi:hypothetical protein
MQAETEIRTELVWTWIAEALDLGQTYYVCALARAFRRRHGDVWPIHVVVANEKQASIASLFSGDIAAVRLAADLASERSQAVARFEPEPFGSLSPHQPIDLGAWTAGGGPSLPFLLDRDLPSGEGFKAILDLPPDVQPAFPEPDEGRKTRARRLLEGAGFEPRRSLIILPSPAAFASYARPHLSALAHNAGASGWTVLYQAGDGAIEIENARPIEIPTDLLAECAEEAGWIVGLRSSEALIASRARCRKTIVYPRRWELGSMGLDALGLAPDAYEFVFPVEGDQSQAFSQRVMGLEADKPVVERRRLSDILLEGRPSTEIVTRDFVDDLRGSIETAPIKRGLLSKKPVAMRLINLPSGHAPDLTELRRAAIARLSLEFGKDSRFYVCRDQAFGFDFFEEVDELSLTQGRFAAAGGWHSAIVVGRGGLAALLPDDAAAKVLPRTPFELGHYQDIGRAVASPAHLAFLNKDRPLALGAFQLIEGWQHLEHWGLWSSGDFSVAKFSVAAPPSAPVTLELDSKVFVSQVSGVLHLVVRVNGSEVLTRDFTQSQDVLLRVTIPPALLSNATAYIEFEHAGVRSPISMGQSPDPRRLALGLSTANLRHGV